MRLRIVHQLSLLLGGLALFSALAIGGWSAWNLRAGFSDYLASRDAQQLERFAEVVAQRVDWNWTTESGEPRRLPMRELMDEFLSRDGGAPPPGWRPPPGPDDGPPGAGPARPRPRRAEAGRIQVVDPSGARLGGPPFPPDRRWLEKPVVVDGRTVAFVRMLPSTQLADVDARFLQRQYTGLAIALGVTLALGLLAAALAARWIGTPVRDVQAAARRIAGGEFGVTVRESGSREMADLIQDVNRMAGSLQQLEGARRRWIAQISHELRTPLSVLQGEIEAVQDGVRPASPEILAMLRSEVLHLVRLVNDLHTLSMADIGHLQCEFSDGPAGAMLQRVAERMAPRLRAGGVELDIDATADPLARWDFGRIEQLLMNLLENSARYTDAPGRARVGWTVRGDDLLLTVEDSAPGVAPDQLGMLFEPLYRADLARRRQAAPGGSGLGLAICRAIVAAHRGTITARASGLGGLQVDVALPLHPEGVR